MLFSLLTLGLSVYIAIKAIFYQKEIPEQVKRPITMTKNMEIFTRAAKNGEYVGLYKMGGKEYLHYKGALMLYPHQTFVQNHPYAKVEILTHPSQLG